MKKLELNQMEVLDGGKDPVNGGITCSNAAGALCAATIILAASPFFFLAGGTGLGCVLGLGCRD